MYDERDIVNKISYLKDVDGLTDINVGHVINGNDGFIPCTPKGIMYLLNFYKIKLKGKHVVNPAERCPDPQERDRLRS